MPNLGSNFYPKLVQIASEVNMKPEDLLAVMVSESGINPSAIEKRFKGSGLIQLMPKTLKGMGYSGSSEDFAKKSGEDQLDYIKQYVQDKMKFHGAPFTSAAQYYVANLWPVGLKLPGVQQADPNTIILEKNPKRAGNKNKYSKKYFDAGYKIDADFENKAYNSNVFFDKDKKGNITYGDMLNQVALNKSNPLYRKALLAMQDQTNYQPSNEKIPTNILQHIPTEKNDLFKQYLSKIKDHGDQVYTELANYKAPNANVVSTQSNQIAVNTVLNNYLHMLTTAEQENNQLYKKYLPINVGLIKIESDDRCYNIEFARILCSVLEEELGARAFTHMDSQKIEVEYSIHGPDNECHASIKHMISSTVDVFKKATIKIGGLDIKTKLITNKKSYKKPIDFKIAGQQYRKFLLKFI